MARKRTSLSQRGKIEADYGTADQPTAAEDDRGAEQDTSPRESTPPAKPAKAAPAPTKATGQTGGEVARIGIYFHPAEFEAARAAYLADWLDGGEADTFARWIGQCITTHAQRTPAKRAEWARDQERRDKSGASRSFSLPASVVEQLHEAIRSDQQAGRWLSDSAWCGEAIDAAVADARKRAGGHLPTPPTRLPNRLRR